MSNDGGLDLGLSTTTSRSASSTRCRPTCGVLTTCAAACRTTMRGADRARCAPPAARSTPTGSPSPAATASTPGRTPPTGPSSTRESQDGNMSRHDLRDGTQKSIRPERAGRARSRCATGARGYAPTNPAALNPPTPPAPGRPRPMRGRGTGRSPGCGRRRTRRRPDAQRDQRAAQPGAAALLLERALRDLAAQSGGGLHGRAVLLQVQQSRRHLVDEPDRSHEERQPLESRTVHHGRARRQADGLEARRLRGQFRRHAGARVSVAARRDLDRHRRRQPAGEPGRRRNLHERLSPTSPARPRATSISRASSPRTSTRAPPTWRSTTIAIDDWKPYLFKTTDYGKTWTSVAGNLPAKGNINALREDYDNPNLLFVGTEFGLFVTLDGGKEWKKFMTGLPSVRVDDILIHPRDRDLIVATHGRSIYIADDITPLEQLKPAGSTKDLTLFDPRPAILWKNDPQAQRHVHQPPVPGEESAGRHRHQRAGPSPTWAPASSSSCRARKWSARWTCRSRPA